MPTLCLSAADDPFQPLDAIPIKAAEECSHVAIVITARGGHIGFLEGWWPSVKEQFMSRLFAEFFSKALCDKRSEFQSVTEDMYENYKIAKELRPPEQEELVGGVGGVAGAGDEQQEKVAMKISSSFLNSEQLEELMKKDM